MSDTAKLQKLLARIEQALADYRAAGGEVDAQRIKESPHVIFVFLPRTTWCRRCNHFSVGTTCQYCASGGAEG